MAILTADILGADTEMPDAAGRVTQIPEDARECEPDLANISPYRLDAPAQFIEIIPCAQLQMQTACPGIPLVNGYPSLSQNRARI
jgi:hypothetical protein